MSRIPLPTPETMTAAQRQVYDRIVAGPRGRLVGPLRAALHNPELADRWQALGALLRFGTSLPPRVSELAIVVTARRWNSQIEWHIHAQAAADAGIASAVLEAIREGRLPDFDMAADEVVYEYARQLQETGQVAPALYARAIEHLGVAGVVELTAVIGYYTMVSMTLNAHEIPMPDDAPDPLQVPTEAGHPALSCLPRLRSAPHFPPATETPRMPGRPRHALMPDACDAHCHVFGPYDRFPLQHPSSYAAPDAPAERYLAMLDTLGARRGVLVQPAPYGTNPAALLDALRQGGGRLRGVAVADPDVSDAQLQAWHDGGVRALRFVEARDPAGRLFPGSVGFDQIAALAPRMKQHGLHAQLWAPCDVYAHHLPALARLGLTLVIDHLGSLVPARGPQDAVFQLIRGLLADGAVWMKLTLCRVGTAPDYADARYLHDAFVAANPDQVLWGSDWPYVRMGDKAPAADALLDLAWDWLGSDTLRQKVWVDNPARLYGFTR